jgi:hypothetical protein
MINIASPFASQRRSFALSVARQRRRGSADDAPGAFPEHGGQAKYRPHAGHVRNFPTLHLPKSFSTALQADHAIQPRPPVPLKSP